MNAPVKKQVIGYVRVSVDNEKKVSPEMQSDAIEKFCDLRDWDLVHVEVERGKSAGEGKKRPGLDKVRRMIRGGAATGLVVWKIDRCSRSVKDFSEILSELQKHKADFVSVTESFDTSNAMGVAMLQITMVFAQLERARSSERITAWAKYRASAGKQPTGPPPFGYIFDDEGCLQIDENTAPLVKQAAQIAAETRNFGDAARFLHAHGYSRDVSSIRRMLQSPTIAGFRYVDGVKVRGEWPAVIDEATHDAIRAELARPERKRGRPRTSWLLTSIAFCDKCGYPMRAGRPQGGGRYMCGFIHAHPHGADPNGAITKCAMTIPRWILDAHVEKKLLAYVTPAMWQAIRAGRQVETKPVVVDVVGLETTLARLAEDYYVRKSITEVEYAAARTGLLARIDEAETGQQDWDAPEVDLPDVADLHGVWIDMPVNEKRLVLQAFIDRVVVKPGRPGFVSDPDERVEIFWR